MEESAMRNAAPFIAKLGTIVGAALVAVFLLSGAGAEQRGPMTPLLV